MEPSGGDDCGCKQERSAHSKWSLFSTHVSAAAGHRAFRHSQLQQLITLCQSLTTTWMCLDAYCCVLCSVSTTEYSVSGGQLAVSMGIRRCNSTSRLVLRQSGRHFHLPASGQCLCASESQSVLHAWVSCLACPAAWWLEGGPAQQKQHSPQ
jgi:hypothetical protein